MHYQGLFQTKTLMGLGIYWAGLMLFAYTLAHFTTFLLMPAYLVGCVWLAILPFFCTNEAG